MKQLCTSLFLFLSFCAQAGTVKNHWSFSESQSVSVPGNRTIFPQKYLLAHLNVNAFQLDQAFIPMENSGSLFEMLLPTPDGGSILFDIVETPMMEQPLASKYSQIKTYTGICQSNKRIIAKIDFTVFGFHAVVFDGANTFYIDPYTNANQDWYIVYYKSDFKKSLNQRMHCAVDEDNEVNVLQNIVHLDDNALQPLSSYKTSGDTVRTYRLALACTEEYSAAVGGTTPTKASVLSAMATTMNRVNGVFEKEFSMHANLVGNTDTLIYLPGSGDPYTNNSGSTMLGQNQTNVNTRIGSSNYDYGHVFSTGGGGIASLSSVCSNTSKAQGVTGSSNPVGDPFDIDYVAHEMGHQFGGSHTFNSVTGSCSGNRSGTSAYEIGSGTTIQAYAGICGTDDIQPHSDDYYHVRSLEQMTGSSVKACAAITMSGNNPPMLISINKSYIIPYKTPFELTATATDVNNDPLTFCWEQYNRGGSGSAWNASTTVAPTFRSFSPDTSGTRVFPQYSELIKNTESYLGELLPDTPKILKFRCTVRDMHNGKGAFYTSIDTTKLDVRSTGGNLFRVTSQNTAGQTWQGFSSQTITWNVAGTNVAPVASTNVNIYLSIDSGRTWPYVLAYNVPNDGSETISVPNMDANWARIKVKGAENVFFDLNDNWIEIKKVVSPNGISSTNEETISIFPNPSNGKFTIQLPSSFQTGKLEIYNVIGTAIFNKELSSNESIQMEHVSKGVYIVKVIEQNKHQHIMKVIVD